MKTVEALSRAEAPVERRFFDPRPEKRQFFIVLCILLWSVLTYLFISHFIMMAVQIKGASMSPTLLDGQRYLLLRFPYLVRSPHRGEIVVIRDPEDHDLSIKRIIGLPNQDLEIRWDGVYVNNQKLAEPYLTAEAVLASSHKRIKTIHLGPRDYYVMGDNRDRSADSRIYGPVPRNGILGVIRKAQ